MNDLISVRRASSSVMKVILQKNISPANLSQASAPSKGCFTWQRAIRLSLPLHCTAFVRDDKVLTISLSSSILKVDLIRNSIVKNSKTKSCCISPCVIVYVALSCLKCKMITNLFLQICLHFYGTRRRIALVICYFHCFCDTFTDI